MKELRVTFTADSSTDPYIAKMRRDLMRSACEQELRDLVAKGYELGERIVDTPTRIVQIVRKPDQT